MKLYFKQRFFSWLDSYDIYGENGDVIYTVKGQISFGHCLNIINQHQEHIGTVKQKLFKFRPTFEIYENNVFFGTMKRVYDFTLHKYEVDFKGWIIEGNFFELDYKVKNQAGEIIATVSKEIFKLTDTYVIDVVSEHDALYVLMIVLAIDAEKCSRN